jgi:LasA protease
VHIARKYNGEWILADGPLAFNLEGWIASAGSAPYEGALTRNGKVIIACTCSDKNSQLISTAPALTISP